LQSLHSAFGCCGLRRCLQRKLAKFIIEVKSQVQDCNSLAEMGVVNVALPAYVALGHATAASHFVATWNMFFND
jgi:hypothetical protein